LPSRREPPWPTRHPVRERRIRLKPILDWQDADWQDTIDVNLTGPATPFAPLRRIWLKRRRTHHRHFIHARTAWHQNLARLFRLKWGIGSL
jgi:hypothetical protein